MEAASLPRPVALPAPRGGRLLRLRTDDQLVALFRLGNDDAFGVIHDRYRARLHAYTRQMLAGSRADAEDALQDVFVRAYGALRADDRPVTLRAWLYRVAHNRCVDALRRPANTPTDELPESAASPHDPTADLQRRDDLRQLVADIGRLPEQQRSALLMRELDGLSYAELADALGVTIPSVKSLLVRARIGLTEAREARDTACVEIRADLAAAHDRGVRVNSRARRHLGECSCCTEYRARLRGVRAGLAALAPAPTGWALVAKLLGLGGGGGGAVAAAGSGGAAGGGAVLVAGGTAKVAALVCCAAVVGGGAVEASHQLAAPKPAATAPARAPRIPAALAAHRAAAVVAPAAATATIAAATPAVGTRGTSVATGRVAPPAEDETVATGAQDPAPTPAAPDDGITLRGASADDDVLAAAAAGGMLAPDEAADPEATPATTGPAADDAAPIVRASPAAATSGDATAPAATGTTGP